MSGDCLCVKSLRNFVTRVFMVGETDPLDVQLTHGLHARGAVAKPLLLELLS